MKSPDQTHSQIKLVRADKTGWQRHWVRRMIHYKVRTSFHSIMGQGLKNLANAYTENPDHGVLAVANHSNWWDFMFGLWLNDHLQVDGYGMTEHANMVKYSFFKRVGIFSMEKSHPPSVKASIEYTAELLQKPRSYVWIMPQGRIMCNDTRPLAFQDGLRLIVRRARRLTIIPVALRYEFWQDDKPEAFVRFGTHENVQWSGSSAENLVQHWQERVTHELDELKSNTLTQDATRFEMLMKGPKSLNQRMEKVSKYAK